MFYVFELQSSATGSALVFSFDNAPDAREKYFDILRVACKSTVRKHGAVIIDENGFVVEPARVFEHDNKTE